MTTRIGSRMAAAAASALLLLAFADGALAQRVRGGGETFVTGGFGFPPIPVRTRFALSIEKNEAGEVTGFFECLALAPSSATGPGSGEFNENIMYVTGRVTALTIAPDGEVSFSGRATVTGLGAGVDLPFDCDVSTGMDTTHSDNQIGIVPGGPGAGMTLEVSGLVFNEILTAGQIVVSGRPRPRAIR
jgi:hypothetical protein